MKKLKFAILFSVLTLPSFAFALLDNTDEFFRSALDILRTLIIPLVFALAMLFFFWGIANYIRKEGHEKDEAKKVMIWGVIALFVMVSVWSLVVLIGDELGLQQADDFNIPGFNLPK